MKKLYFARHGLTVMNIEGNWSGTTETPLTKQGIDQAKQAGMLAKDLGIDYIACSPLSRTKDTAKIIAKEIKYPVKNIHINPLLIERHFGELEGKPYKPDFNMDGIADVETVETILYRAKVALEWLHTVDAENILVVSHGSFGRALRSLVLEEHQFHPSKKLANAEIHRWI
jgi:broad specificity phosphatase PhoE